MEKTLTEEKLIPFGRPSFTEEEIDAVARVMRSGWIGMGNEVVCFENELAEYIGVKNVVTVDSCTSALYLSLLASGIGKGDEVIVPSMTWCSTANAVIYCGAQPVFCDINSETLCSGTDDILKQVTSKTKAVIILHYGGYAVDINELRRNLPDHICIIEDAAHAFGSIYPDGTKVGSSGNLTCFSFYANKNLSTGEGGAICLNDHNKTEILKSLRQLGMPSNSWKKYLYPNENTKQEVQQLGYKMNYIDLHACIGRVQLQRFNAMQQIRQGIVNKYLTALSQFSPPLVFQKGIEKAEHSKHLLVLQLPIQELSLTRDEILVALRKMNVGAGIHYMPLHLMEFYRKNYKASSLPNCEMAYKKIITLPISSSMTESDIDVVVKILREIYK